MTSGRIDWTQEGAFVDAAGQQVRAYDDVTLLHDVPQTRPGNTSIASVPAGSRATVLFFTRGKPVLLDLECYPSPESFTFAQALAEQVRFAMRAEDKHRAGPTG